jgi:opacity protein-like surface antigen
MKKIVFLVALGCFAAMASAQVRDGTMEVEPFYGYLWGGQFARGTTQAFSTRVDVADHATYGVRLGYNVTSKFELEAQASRTDTHFVGHGEDIFGSSPELGTLRVDYLLGYLTFNFGHSRAVPYVTLGGGVARLDPSIPDVATSSTTRGTGSLGAGLKYFVNPHFGLRFDGRVYATYLSSSDECGHFDRCDNSHYLTNGNVTGGIILAF